MAYASMSNTYAFAPAASSHILPSALDRAAAPRSGFSWSMPKRDSPRRPECFDPSLRRDHPKHADASKIHEMIPGTKMYVSMMRVNKHSIIRELQLETSTSYHLGAGKAKKPGTIPGRPDFKPVAKFMKNAGHGGFQHVRPLDDMLAEAAAYKDKLRAERKMGAAAAGTQGDDVAGAARAPTPVAKPARPASAKGRSKDQKATQARLRETATLDFKEQQAEGARLHMRGQQLAFAEADLDDVSASGSSNTSDEEHAQNEHAFFGAILGACRSAANSPDEKHA